MTWLFFYHILTVTAGHVHGYPTYAVWIELVTHELSILLQFNGNSLVIPPTVFPAVTTQCRRHSQILPQ